ncbi:hypothetical protein ACFL0C_02225 [Patescibacteria group bacterium]
MLVDTIGDTTLEAIVGFAGVITFVNKSTNEEITPLRSFWFAWAAVSPGTEIF